jgi:hypothetical protein
MTTDGFDQPRGDAVDRWLSEIRVVEAARSRARVGALKAHAAEDATMVGVLADLAERGAPVMLSTVHGRRHRVEVLVVGPDAAVFALGTGESLVMRVTAIASLRLVGGDPVHGEGSITTTSRFGRILARAADPGDRLRLAVGGETVTGAVVALSAEVALLALESGALTYVSLDAVEEALVRALGG